MSEALTRNPRSIRGGARTRSGPSPRALHVTPAMPLVIGLTGPNGSGKGEVASLLQDLGFHYLSLADVVREEARRRGREPVRDVLIALGRELRREGGPGVLAERILSRVEPPCVVDSVRNPGEVAVLRQLPSFFLLGITAPPEMRHERIRRRGRPGDPQSYPEFLRKEETEDSADEEGQRSSATLALADRIVVNDSTLEVLSAKVHTALEDLQAAMARGEGG